MIFRKIALIFFVLLFILAGLSARDWVVEKIKAEKLFNEYKFDEAIILFKEIILSSKNDKFIAESYFWLAKAYMNTNKLKLAETNLEYYLANYKTTGLNYPEAFYEKGRLLFLQEQYQQSIDQLNNFIKSFPDNIFVSNAYYWIGECLYALGQFDDSSYYFTLVITKFPNCIKDEASRYKLRLIEHKKSELALQNLLKWSQEQYLASLAQFRIREKTLQEALDKYKNGLPVNDNKNTAVNTNTSNNSTGNNQDEINSLRQQIADLQSENNYLKGNTNNKELADKMKQLELREKLLKDKEEALRLLEKDLRSKGK